MNLSHFREIIANPLLLSFLMSKTFIIIIFQYILFIIGGKLLSTGNIFCDSNELTIVIFANIGAFAGIIIGLKKLKYLIKFNRYKYYAYAAISIIMLSILISLELVINSQASDKKIQFILFTFLVVLQTISLYIISKK